MGSVSTITAQICWAKQSFFMKQVTLRRTDSLKSTKVPMNTTELIPFPPKKNKAQKNSLNWQDMAQYLTVLFLKNSKSTILY